MIKSLFLGNFKWINARLFYAHHDHNWEIIIKFIKLLLKWEYFKIKGGRIWLEWIHTRNYSGQLLLGLRHHTTSWWKTCRNYWFQVVIGIQCIFDFGLHDFKSDRSTHSLCCIYWVSHFGGTLPSKCLIY